MKDPTLTGDVELSCPRCQGVNLHHGPITNFDRDEDAKLTLIAIVSGGKAELRLMPSAWARNPSERRSGISIDFECEHCGGGLEFCIAQHKGLTLLSWRETVKAK